MRYYGDSRMRSGRFCGMWTMIYMSVVLAFGLPAATPCFSAEGAQVREDSEMHMVAGSGISTVREAWRVSTAGELTALLRSGGRLYAGDAAGHVYVLDPSSGKTMGELKLQKGIRAMIVGDGTVYAATDDGVKAADLRTGKLKWAFSSGDGALSLTATGGIILATSKNGRIRAIDARNGRLRWEYKAGPSIEGPVVHRGRAFAGSRLHYEVPFGRMKYDPADHFIRAFDLRTGRLLWSYEGEDDIFTPVVYGGIVCAGSYDGKLRAFDAATGRLRWSHTAGSQIYAGAVFKGVVYTGSTDNKVRAFDLKTGRLLWEFDAGGEALAPQAGGGILAVTSMNNRLRALDPLSGRLLWEARLQTGVAYPLIGSGRVFSVSAPLGAYDAGTGRLLWEYASETPPVLPVLGGNMIYVPSGKGLVSLPLGKTDYRKGAGR